MDSPPRLRGGGGGGGGQGGGGVGGGGLVSPTMAVTSPPRAVLSPTGALAWARGGNARRPSKRTILVMEAEVREGEAGTGTRSRTNTSTTTDGPTMGSPQAHSGPRQLTLSPGSVADKPALRSPAFGMEIDLNVPCRPRANAATRKALGALAPSSAARPPQQPQQPQLAREAPCVLAATPQPASLMSSAAASPMPSPGPPGSWAQGGVGAGVTLRRHHAQRKSRPRSCLQTVSEGAAALHTQSPIDRRRHSVSVAMLGGAMEQLEAPAPFESPIDMSATSRLFGKALSASTPTVSRRSFLGPGSETEAECDDNPMDAAAASVLALEQAVSPMLGGGKARSLRTTSPRNHKRKLPLPPPRPSGLQAVLSPSALDASSSSSGKRSLGSAARHEEHRLNVGQELLGTEKTYVNCLRTLLDVFKHPLEAAAIISDKETQVLFSPQLDVLLARHASLLQTLEARLAGWDCRALLGDIFVRLAEAENSLLAVYTAYLNDFPACIQALRKLAKHSSAFRAFLDAAKLDPRCSNLDLTAFLLTPIQRLPRYLLLLKSLAKCTPQAHEDHALVGRSIELVKAMVAELNESFQRSSILAGELMKHKKRKKRNRSSQGLFSRSSIPLIERAKSADEAGGVAGRQRSASLSMPSSMVKIVGKTGDGSSTLGGERKRLLSMFSKQTSEPAVLSPSRKRKSDEAFPLPSSPGLSLLAAMEGKGASGSTDDLATFPNKTRRLFGGFRSRIGSLGKKMVSRQNSACSEKE